MNADLKRQLGHRDVRQRATAIKAVVRDKEVAAIPYLMKLAEADPDPRIREMASWAVQRLEGVRTAKAPRPVSSTQLPKKAAAGLPSIEDLKRIEAEKAARRRNNTDNATAGVVGSMLRPLFFIIFTVGLIAIGTLVVFQRMDYLNNVRAAMAMGGGKNFGSPDAMPVDISVYRGALDGGYYRKRHTRLTEYYVLEPVGERPSGGWPVLLGVHGSGGNGEQVISAMGERAREEGVILVAPTFTPMTPGGSEYDGDYMTAEIVEIMAYLDHVYGGFHPTARVMYGFSMGCMATYGVTIKQPRLFYGGGLFGCRSIDGFQGMPPRNTPIRYVVITGGDDSRVDVTQDFIQKMEQRGTPLYVSDIEPGVGHWMSPYMTDQLFVMVNSLR